MPERTGRDIGGACLELEMLSAYVDGMLDTRERAAVEAHLAVCPDCYELMSEVLHIQEAVPAARPDEVPVPVREDVPAPAPRPGGGTVLRGVFGRRKFVWGGAAVALVAAAALVLVVRTPPAWWTGDVDPKLADLVEAVGEERTVEARLTGGFKYGPLRSPTRSGGRVGPTDNWKLLAAAGRIREEAEKDPTPENLHALGVAQLLLHDWDGAVRSLEATVTQGAANAEQLNDLAAAYLARSIHEDRPSDLPLALETLERLAVSQSCAECRFNQALTLELMHFYDDAIIAWDAYLSVDGTSRWAEEGRKRRDALRARQPATSEFPLPRARCLDDLYKAYEQAQMAQLANLGSVCAETASSNDVRLWALYLSAVGSYYTGRLSQAERMVAEIRDSLPRDDSTHRHLDARLLYLRGGLLFARGDYHAGLESAAQASALLESTGDRSQLSTIYQATAEAYRALGQTHEAWRFYLRALELGANVSSGIRRHALLNSVGLASLGAGLPHVATRVLTVAEHNAEHSRQFGLLGEALLNRARGLSELGSIDRAEADLNRAGADIERVTDLAIRTRLAAEWNAARAEILVDSSPSDAIRSAQAASKHYSALDVKFRQASLQLTLARAHLKANRNLEARAALLRGIDLIETEQAKLEERRLRISHLDKTWDLYRDLVSLTAEEGNPREGLTILERQRARMSTATSASDASWRALEPATLALVYMQTPFELLRWEVSRDRVGFTKIPVTSAVLDASIEAFRTRMRTSDTTASSDVTTALSKFLLSGVENQWAGIERLVIVPDGSIGSVPFGALTLPSSDMPLSERVSTALTPSLGSYLRANDASIRARQDSLVVLSHPTPTEEGLSTLPSALQEATGIAALYGDHRVIEGPSATPAAFLEALQTVGMVHFIGHAVADAANPWRSRLLLAPDARHPTGAWSVTDVPDRGVRAITILAACSTAGGAVRRGIGLVSLASEMLAAGAPAVVATLWDIADDEASDLFVHLHRELRSHGRPSAAVKAVQASPHLPASKWALVVFGT